MLAHSFKTAAELGLPESFYDELVWFYNAASSGEIKDEVFDMRIVGHPECGTPGCILGHIRAHNRDAFHVWLGMGNPRSIGYLFYDEAPHRTVQQAAEAVFKVLQGEPCPEPLASVRR